MRATLKFELGLGLALSEILNMSKTRPQLGLNILGFVLIAFGALREIEIIWEHITPQSSGGIWRVYILSKPFMAAKICVLGLSLSSSPYLRSATARFPLLQPMID